MMRRIKRLARAAAASVVHLGLRSARIRALITTEMGGPRPAPRPGRSTPDGVFVDRHGVAHPLDWSLRDRLKPGWRTMCDPAEADRPPTDEALAGRARKAEKIVAEASTLVATHAGRPLGGRILEIGCYDGAVAFQLARRGGAEVVASDMARYYVVQRPGRPVDTDLATQQAALATLRERARAAAGVAPGLVHFVEDDITASALEPGSFDAIVSFEVLEHVRNPAEALAAMARLLKPGGVAYHDYNPFFSLIGGHSLCTLDFPWGHARLDAGDVERYLQEVRPDAVTQTLRFYTESLNRMTLADLRVAVAAAGLELLALVPWSDRTLVAQLGPDVLAEVRRTYPTATAEDLLATFAAVVLRRPA
jgi:SAM-dependent methyltransferase